MSQPFLTEKDIQNKVSSLTECQLVSVVEGEENYYLVTGKWEDGQVYLAQFWHDFKSPWFESREHGTPAGFGSGKNNVKIAPLIVPQTIAKILLEGLRNVHPEKEATINRALVRLGLS